MIGWNTICVLVIEILGLLEEEIVARQLSYLHHYEC